MTSQLQHGTLSQAEEEAEEDEDGDSLQLHWQVTQAPLGDDERSSSPDNPQLLLARLDVFRRAFAHFIAAFGSYAPLLLAIQTAYEDVVRQLRDTLHIDLGPGAAALRDPEQYYNPMTQAQLQAKLGAVAFDFAAYRAAYFGETKTLPTFACETAGAADKCDVIGSGPAYCTALSAAIAARPVATGVAYLQLRVLARQRGLGMRPVLGAFAGAEAVGAAERMLALKARQHEMSEAEYAAERQRIVSEEDAKGCVLAHRAILGALIPAGQCRQYARRQRQR